MNNETPILLVRAFGKPVGTAESIRQAKNLGRSAVKSQDPRNEGVYMVTNARTEEPVFSEERSLRTNYRWKEVPV